MRQRHQKNEAGFTLMEIVVASTLFTIVCVAMLGLFDYTLKINRRSEALRQATQGMRNFVETLVKEIRNGNIDYGIQNGVVTGNWPLGACGVPMPIVGGDTYRLKENKIGLVTDDGQQECIYYADDTGNKVASTVFSAPSGHSYTLVLEKIGGVKEILNPPNYNVESLVFFIRPLCDPYTTSCSGGLPKTQPFVTMDIRFVAKLPTGETVTIPYQTTVSSNQYDIPNK